MAKNAAVEGRLTEAGRAKDPNTEPATKLLERILAERREKGKEDQLAKFAAANKKELLLPGVDEGWVYGELSSQLIDGAVALEDSESDLGLEARRVGLPFPCQAFPLSRVIGIA